MMFTIKCFNTRHKAKSTYNIFIVRAVGRIISCRSFGITLQNNIDHRVKETCVMFGLPVKNNSAVNVSLPFSFDFFIKIAVFLTK